jgi:hypothetical protein
MIEELELLALALGKNCFQEEEVPFPMPLEARVEGAAEL